MRHGCTEDIVEKLDSLPCWSFSTISSMQPCRMMTTVSSMRKMSCSRTCSTKPSPRKCVMLGPPTNSPQPPSIYSPSHLSACPVGLCIPRTLLSMLLLILLMIHAWMANDGWPISGHRRFSISGHRRKENCSPEEFARDKSACDSLFPSRGFTCEAAAGKETAAC